MKVELACGLVAMAAPVARWTCERSAQAARGTAKMKKATAAGNGFRGSCSIECGDGTVNSEGGR